MAAHLNLEDRKDLKYMKKCFEVFGVFEVSNGLPFQTCYDRLLVSKPEIPVEHAI